MILQRYILREIVATFLMVFLTISMIFFIGIGIQQYRRGMEGLGLIFLVKSAPFMFCYVMRYSIPAGTLMASVLVFGRLAAENEIVAIRASGIPLTRIVSPALAVGLWLTFFFLVFNDHVAPLAIHLQRRTAQQSVVATLQNPPPLGTSLNVSSYRLHYKRFNNGVFEEFAIGRAESGGPIKEAPQSVDACWARTARFLPGENGQPPRFRLQHVIWLRAVAKDSPHAWPIGQALTYEYPIDIEPLFRGSKRFIEMTTPELFERLDSEPAGPPGRVHREIWAERHQRMAWAVSPFVLTLLGAPIGTLLRKGSRMAGFGASLPGGTAYFLLATMGQVFGTRIVLMGQVFGIKIVLPPLLVIWAADGLFFIVGVVLLWRVYRT
jgi:lipopolysaccharide export LptBFGC system permease protein LptF